MFYKAIRLILQKKEKLGEASEAKWLSWLTEGSSQLSWLQTVCPIQETTHSLLQKVPVLS